MKLLILVILVTGCSSYRPKTDYMAEKSYQDKPVVKQSILEDDVINEKEIQRILSGRVRLPKKMRLAVFRLKANATSEPTFYGYSRAGLKQNTMDDSFVSLFYKKLASTNNIETVIPVPSGLIPDSPSLKQLRLAAIRLQAHVALVINTNSDITSNFDLFDGTSAKSLTAAECYLVDTASGIILTTGTYSDMAEVLRDKKDYDTTEAMKRAKLESEKKIFAGIATDISEYLGKATH